ncbi:hypothetical protein MJG53_005706 [Ovis ammon polii x Ovis aries]|uniref:Uncharacterized protein n=1 Tax=Ovis ammon polii x Ovis aries TaxID=2918886 RepID=A0ACB9V6Z6_9CETA|nr:hypothetical protein MJG53_005706 [Ovis ammon polii x Ovis aries]
MGMSGLRILHPLPLPHCPAELKIPLICRVPRKMNRPVHTSFGESIPPSFLNSQHVVQGSAKNEKKRGMYLDEEMQNSTSTKEVLYNLICDLPSVTTCLSGEDDELKAADAYLGSLFCPRSWPRIDSATGQYQTINEPLLDSVSQLLSLPILSVFDIYKERNSIAVLAGAKGHTDGDYEDPELHTGEDWQSVKILPARPIKESEYADTRYFKGMMDTPLSLDSKTSLPTDKQTWTKLEEVEKPISKDIRKQHVKDFKALGKATQFGDEDTVPYHQMKPEAPHLAQNQSPQEIPLAVASSSFMTRNPTVQNRGHHGRMCTTGVVKSELHLLKVTPDALGKQGQNLKQENSPEEIALKNHKESMPSYAPQRCQSPAGSGPQENPLLHKITSRKKPFPARSDGKDVQHNEWYIGEYSRQAVEEALLKEHKNGTFLVRDCSAKSRAEPYVLAVFYGNKVYNVKIRFLERNQQFALGTGLRGDEKFDSVEAIIEHYKYFPIILIDGKDKTGTHREQCYLTQALPVNRHFSPR